MVIIAQMLQKELLCDIKTGAYRGYLMCSIRGTNNQLPNIFYKFVHLQLFNITHNTVHVKSFEVKFLFSENHVFCKQKRMAVYGHMDTPP